MPKSIIPIAKPTLGRKEEKAVIEVLRSGKLVQGEIVEAFEKEFAKYIGTKHAIAVVNGTAALHLALLGLGIGPGDEIITTAFSFIASSSVINLVGAKPVFVDIDENSYTIDSSKIEEKITKKTKAILPVHLYGLSANMGEITKLAHKHKLFVLEDACQSHGAIYKDKKVGNIGTLGCFSFYATKNMITGEGGMITTNNTSLAKQLRLLRQHGMSEQYYHDILGFNYRMTNIAAAIGRIQLEKLDKANEKRRKNAEYYNKYFSHLKGLIVPWVPSEREHVYHQYTIAITKDFPLTRDQLKALFVKHGIMTGVYYPLPIHKQRAYKGLGYDDRLPVTERLTNCVLSLPVHPSLTKKDLARVVEVIMSVY